MAAAQHDAGPGPGPPGRVPAPAQRNAVPARARLAALAALVLAAIALGAVVAMALDTFPLGLVGATLAVAAAAAGWEAALHRGVLRTAGLVLAALLLAAAVVVLVGRAPLGTAILVGALALGTAAARAAFRVHTDLTPAAPPRHPVLFYNPRSGGGKAARFDLPAEARARGMEPVELRPGEDLEALVRDAVARGADGLAMAGGDGSQAIVAAIAAEHRLPYACIPAGTRNHFALDLGVDRDDVVGALDAFVDGGERLVDLADVNGRIFVNNVSLGLYAEAVQQQGYREAKLRTILDTVPEAVGRGSNGADLRWTGPGGHEHRGGAAILVSNNRYRLGRAVGSGTRPAIDDGRLGVTVVGTPRGGGHRGRRLQRPWREWTASEFEVRSDHPVPAGIDGESVVLAPPLRFRCRPGVLRVRISPRHPGASPSAHEPDGALAMLGALVRLAAGRR
ncbi:MAG: diacylglycerol kinase [Solirubrobacterales bacterium]|nr:diacylglycerol kinase [Solirubrobacterales bacterium]